MPGPPLLLSNGHRISSGHVKRLSREANHSVLVLGLRISRATYIDNSSTERVEEFRYLGTTLTNQNSIQEEIKSRLKLGNAG